MSKVVVANDHGAVELTARIVDFLKGEGYEVNYLGTAENKSVDYPDMAKLACDEFKRGGRIDYSDDVIDMLKAYIGTQTSQDERHARRREKMMALEG